MRYLIKEKSSRLVTMHRYLHCLINAFNKAINLRMSSRTIDEFDIQFPYKRLPNFANKAGLSFRHNELWNTMKSIIAVNKGSHCFVSVDFLCHEQKCAISDGKQESIIVLKWISGPYKPVTKSIPSISQG